MEVVASATRAAGTRAENGKQRRGVRQAAQSSTRRTVIRTTLIVLATLVVLVGVVTVVAADRERRSTETAMTDLLLEAERHITSLIQERERFAYAFSVNPAIVLALSQELTVQANYAQLRDLLDTLGAQLTAAENLHSIHLVSYVNRSVFTHRGRVTISEYPDRGLLSILSGATQESFWIADRKMVDSLGTQQRVLTHALGLPLTSQRKTGWLVLNYRTIDFLAPVLATKGIRGLRVNVVDSAAARESGSAVMPTNQTDDLAGDVTIDVLEQDGIGRTVVAAKGIAGRNWTIVMQAPAGQFRGAAVPTLEIVVLALGLTLVTALVVFYLAGRAFAAPIQSIIKMLPRDSRREEQAGIVAPGPRIAAVEFLRDMVEETVNRNRQYEETLREYDKTMAEQEKLLREKSILDVVVNQSDSSLAARDVLEPYWGAEPGAWRLVVVVVRFYGNGAGGPRVPDLRAMPRSRAARIVGASDVITARLDRSSYLSVVVFPGAAEAPLHQLVNRLRRYVGMRSSVAFGWIHVGIGCAKSGLNELNESFREAMAVLDSLRWEAGHAVEQYEASQPFRSDPKLQQEYADLRRGLLANIRTKDSEAARGTYAELTQLLASRDDVGAFGRTMMVGQLARDLTLENSAAHSGLVPPENSLLAFNQIRDYDELLRWMESLVSDTIEAATARAAGRHSELIRRALEYVDEHYSEPLTLQTIEDEFGVTMSHFGKIFRERTGTTFHKHLTDVRVQRASEMLTTTNYPIRVVAAECGFENRQNLIRVFRRTKGATPTEYRRRADGFVS